MLLKESVGSVYRYNERGGGWEQACTKQNQGEKSQLVWGNSGKQLASCPYGYRIDLAMEEPVNDIQKKRE